MEIAIVTIGVVASINALVIFWVSKIHTKTLEKLHEEVTIQGVGNYTKN